MIHLPKQGQSVKITLGRSVLYGKADFPVVESASELTLPPLRTMTRVESGLITILLEDGPAVDLQWDSTQGPIGWEFEVEGA